MRALASALIMVILITRERLTGGIPRPRPITAISIIIKRKVRIRRSPSLSFVAQSPSQTVNLQMHAPSVLFMRDVTPTSRLAPTMHNMHINLSVLSPLKVEKLVLMLGTNRLPSIWT